MKKFSFLLLVLTAVAQSPREFARTYSTLATLQSSAIDLQHQTVILRGWDSEGDGRGGLFRYDSSSAVTTNTFDTFAPSYGQATGRWLRVISGDTRTDFTTDWIGSQWLTPGVDAPVQLINAATATPIIQLSATNAFDGFTWTLVNLDTDTNIEVTVDNGAGGTTAFNTLYAGTVLTVVYDQGLVDAYYVSQTAPATPAVYLAGIGGGSGDIVAKTLSQLSTTDGTVTPRAYVTDAGQEGVFKWVADASAPSWVTDPDTDLAGMWYDEAATTDGVWPRVIDGAYNVRWFGAKGDGVTDDTAAVQAAIDLATQNTSDTTFTDNTTIFFPAGDYILNGDPLYAFGNRKAALSLTIVGSGEHATRLKTTRTDGLPMWQMDQMKFQMTDLMLWGPHSTTTSMQDYLATGVHCYNSDFFKFTRVRFNGFSRGVVLDNEALNWGSFIACDFYLCTVGIFGPAMQASYVQAHFEACGINIYGVGNGINLNTQWEGAGVCMGDMPAAHVFPTGGFLTAQASYGEGVSGGTIFPFMVGVQATNKVTMSAVGDQVTVTFTNVHLYPKLTTFKVNSILAGAGGADVTSGILNWQTWNSGQGTSTNKTLTFTAYNAITTDLSGHVFELIGPTTNINWVALDISCVDMGSYSGPILMDRVEHPHIFVRARNQGNAVQYTSNTINPKIEFISDSYSGHNDYQGMVKQQNIFPDPEFVGGTNFITAFTGVGNGAVISTNTGPALLDSGIMVWSSAKPTSSYMQQRMKWIPTIPAASLVGKRIVATAWVKALDLDSYKPTAFTVAAAGTGYSDGAATVTDGSRTVTVTLTTDAGAITDAVWYWGTFATSAGLTGLAVTQAGGSSGQLDVSGTTDSSHSVDRDILYLAVTQNGGATAIASMTSDGGSLYDTPEIVTRFKNDNMRIYFGSGVVPSGTTSLGLYAYAPSVDGTTGDGDEFWVIDKFLVVLAQDVTRYDDLLRLDYNRDWSPASAAWYRTATSNFGASWPATSDGVAAIFAKNDVDGTTAIAIKDEAGTSGAVAFLPTITSFTEISGSVTVAFTRNPQVATVSIDEDTTCANTTGKQAGREVMLRVSNTDVSTHTFTLNASWNSFGEASPITVPASSAGYLRVSLQCFGTAEANIDAAAVLQN